MTRISAVSTLFFLRLDLKQRDIIHPTCRFFSFVLRNVARCFPQLRQDCEAPNADVGQRWTVIFNSRRAAGRNVVRFSYPSPAPEEDEEVPPSVFRPPAVASSDVDSPTRSLQDRAGDAPGRAVDVSRPSHSCCAFARGSRLPAHILFRLPRSACVRTSRFCHVDMSAYPYTHHGTFPPLSHVRVFAFFKVHFPLSWNASPAFSLILDRHDSLGA